MLTPKILLNLYIYFSSWPLEATLLESLWGLFGGGFASVSMIGYTYVSDVTSHEDRTARISALDAFPVLASPLGNLLGAKLFLYSGYYPVFLTSGLFAVLGALYAATVLKETVPREKVAARQGLRKMLQEKNPLTILRTLVRPRSGLKRTMVLWSFFLFVVHNMYNKDGLYLYTRKKFNWNEQDFSYFTLADSLHGFTRAVIVTPFLSKVLLVHDPLIGMMGAMSWVTTFTVWALATQGWLMYLATGLGTIGGLTSTPIITLLTKLVDREETGAVMAMSSGLIVLEQLASSVLFSQVYSLTVATQPGLIYLIMAAIYTVVAVMFLTLLFILLRQEAKYESLDVMEKEQRVKDDSQTGQAKSGPRDSWYSHT